ncbi:MAG TPA: hypothetical protein VNX21_02645 [Candidatus Thermoplasmatota archaeon]|nr:hypothetical protein [Candidatus Thermoplasmatota archaeon]
MRRPLLWTLFGLGLLLAAALAAWVAGAPDRERLAVVAATELAAGREAALSTGLALNVPWARAAALTTGIEWSMLLVGAPLLVLGGDWLRERPWVRRRLARAEAFARERPRTGVLALAALTLTPFLPVGALTSVLIGEVLALPLRLLLPALALAELAANFGFAFLASHALGLLPDPRLGAALMAGALLLAALALAFWPRKPIGAHEKP